ncbi:MAG TPA: FCD domain-containing protein [Methylomirabilota bacterium]|nr:FCD domain-containing protein [Methylomirabilota bacterium]
MSDLVPLASPARRRNGVVESICDLIERRALKAGERLPPERELTRLLATSRTSVREALRMLDGLGVVEIRHGRGAYVRAGASRLGVAWWEEYLADRRDRILDILEVRELLDARAAALAARRASGDEIAALRSVLEAQAQAVEADDVAAVVVADVQFHNLIARISRNALLAELAKGIINALHDDREATFRMPGRTRRSLDEHSAVLEAISRGDAEAAERLMRTHVQETKAHILRLRS